MSQANISICIGVALKVLSCYKSMVIDKPPKIIGIFVDNPNRGKKKWK
jgi:hypothetical protein